MLELVKRFFSLFRGLRGRLVLGYTFVTVFALLVLEMLAGSVIILAFLASSSDASYLYTVHTHLGDLAASYLQPGQEDLDGLQSWAQYTALYGYPRHYSNVMPLYSSETGYVGNMYVIDPEGMILACAPACSEQAGAAYQADDVAFVDGPLAWALSPDAQQSSGWDSEFYRFDENGNYQLAIPILYWPEPDSIPSGDMPVGDVVAEDVVVEELVAQLLGVVIVTVQPPPPLADLLPVLTLGAFILAVTGFMLLVAVTPFGILFGLIMSRGLTRRLGDLTRAADAWSEGDFSVQPRVKGGDEIGHLSMRMRHMAERIQNLLQSQQELAMLEERNRLARDLHDTIKQQTFAILMQLRAAQNQIETDPAAANQTLQEAESLVKTAQQDLGRIIAELRPAALEGQGLALALRNYLDTWSQHTRIPVEFHVQGERSLALSIEQPLYRIAQEALSNVARHSSASAVTVNLAYDAKQVRLSIHDNGRGFDPAAINGQNFGLQSMQQRTDALDGQFEVSSGNEHGTTLTVVIPLKAGG
ncbi:MAG TPA: histidine kinase [Anaerolineales bacterium]|nr:histidine kinase [Anaerolineales bacterium]